MAKKGGLGRGLSELLGEVEQAYKSSMGSGKSSIVELEIDKIIPNPYQPRKKFDPLSLQELSDSIQEYGLLQPILVYEENEQYVLIAGERRLRASKLGGAERIRAIIADIDLGKLREVALIENIQREDLNPIDLANAYEELIRIYGLTHEELAERLQKSRVQITNTLRLLGLTQSVQDFLIEGKITQGHAKVLVTLDANDQDKIAHTIIGQKLSVRDVEQLVKRVKKPQNHQMLEKVIIQDEIQKEIERILQKNGVHFVFKNKSLTLSISLKNNDEAKRFLHMIEK